jgi:Tol biopolymer transport system component
MKTALRAALALLVAATALTLATTTPAGARAACTIDQVTDVNGNPSFDSAPIPSADGTRIVFDAAADLTGDNPDGSFEIFLHDTTDGPGGETTQLTDTTGTSSESPSISGDGTRIAFASGADLTGDNADGSFEIFLIDTAAGPGGATTQLTDDASGFSTEPAVSGDGTHVAFRSTADLTGDNPDHNFEIFLHDTTTGTTTQLTDTTVGSSVNASITGDGTYVAFASNADHTGDNDDGNNEIFQHDTTAGTTTQLTDTTSGNSIETSISADGTRITFSSSSDHTGDNPDGNPEIYLHDTIDGTTTQLTDATAGVSFAPTLAADGTRIVFTSDTDHTGDNPDGNEEIFLATCGSPTPSFNDVGLNHPFFAEIEWLAATEVTGGFPDGGYHPSAPVSRQAMAAFMFRLAGEPPFGPPAEPSFGDVTTSHPFFAEIEWLAAVEVTGGFPDGGYHPAAPVTRQAMAAFLFRLADGPGVDLAVT